MLLLHLLPLLQQQNAFELLVATIMHSKLRHKAFLILTAILCSEEHVLPFLITNVARVRHDA
jgi:hypothetical protein